MSGQSKKILVHVDMGGNEVKNFVVDKYASDPSTGIEGQMIYNSTADQIKIYTGSQWVALASGGAMPTPSSDDPQMDGTASPGSSNAYARGDHVHPTDTSRQAALSTAQMNAVNSGITSAKVSTYDGYQSQIDGKQPTGDYATNTALTTGLATKQNTLTAGVGIEINNNIISADTAFHAQVFSALPTASAAYKNTVGLILKSGSTTQYLTYMCTTENSGTTWSWKQIGTTDMDLSDYYTKTQTDDLLDDKQPVGDYATNTALTNGLAGKVDTTRKVNGHALSADITVTKSDVNLGSVVNAGMDTTVTSGSNNYITSGAVATAIDANGKGVFIGQYTGSASTTTSFTDITAAYNAGKKVYLKNIINNEVDGIYSLMSLSSSEATFTYTVPFVDPPTLYSLAISSSNTYYVDMDLLESETNKVTSIASSSTDNQYPSAKAVYTYVNNNVPKEASLTIQTSAWTNTGHSDYYTATVAHTVGAIPKSVELYDSSNNKVITSMNITSSNVIVYSNTQPSETYTLKVIS